MNILEFIEKEKKPSEIVLEILELMENLPIPDDPDDITGYGLKLKRFNNERCIIQADNPTASKFSEIYGLNWDVLNCELQKRYGIRFVSMNPNPSGAELEFKFVPQSSFQPRKTGYYLPTGESNPLIDLKFSESISESIMEKFKKHENLNDPEFLKEAKNHFHEVFMSGIKEKFGGVNPVSELSEKAFEKLFDALIRVGKEFSEEVDEHKKKIEDEAERFNRGIDEDEAARHTVRFSWEK